MKSKKVKVKREHPTVYEQRQKKNLDLSRKSGTFKIHHTYRWKNLRKRILIRDLYTCQKCNRYSTELEVDHIIPLHLGGAPYEENNLETLCNKCHFEKSQQERKSLFFSKR